MAACLSDATSSNGYVFGAGNSERRARLGGDERRCAIGEDESNPAGGQFQNENLLDYRLGANVGRDRNCANTVNGVALQAARRAAIIAACSERPV